MDKKSNLENVSGLSMYGLVSNVLYPGQVQNLEDYYGNNYIVSYKTEYLFACLQLSL